MLIRPINLNDARATLEIYRPYVEGNIISFEGEAPSIEEWKERIQKVMNEYVWLVCEDAGKVIGYAYGTRHRYRTAYNWSVESTIYMSDQFHRKGVGKILYETLFEILKLQGYVNVYAGVTMPNPKSEQFHLALGFYDVGYFRKIGFKLGEWHDTRWFQLHLKDDGSEPGELKTFESISNSKEVKEIFQRANERLGR